MIGRPLNDIDQILTKKQMNRIFLKTTANFEPNTLETPISSILQTLSMKSIVAVAVLYAGHIALIAWWLC